MARIDLVAAERLFKQFAPMFERFEKNGVDYCLVGGLGVLAHCVVHGFSDVRATGDADLIVPHDYENVDFARDYLAVYAANPDVSQAVYNALFGDDGFDELLEDEAAFINVSFVGADMELDGVDTPDFDICRVLNGRDVRSLRKERLCVFGIHVWVASVDDLLGMKRDTIAMYGVDINDSARPQDFIDVFALEKIVGNGLV